MIGEWLRRLGDNAFAKLLEEALRAAFISVIIVLWAPWDSEIRRIESAQIVDRIIENKRTRADLQCNSVAVSSERFRRCEGIQNKIDRDKERLKTKSMAPLAKARAALQ